ncbi:zinc finger protein 62 homolog [Anneissia japonica]|uniref:zinc finger protein 62 homolog n=1 Tax=Anneissia japonica TaxID=1529436 RepID=UPI001425A3F6|nr:zinc finger protein 62 homolog [Anneissia japonica]XP_033118078.1 zinc finger protein 62 homolog [Anneissia japonica]
MDSESESDCDEFSFTCDKCSFVTKDLQEIKKHTREHKKLAKNPVETINSHEKSAARNKTGSRKIRTKQDKRKERDNEVVQIPDEVLNKSTDQQNNDTINLDDSSKSDTHQIAEEIDVNLLDSNITSGFDVSKEKIDATLLHHEPMLFFDGENVGESEGSNSVEGEEIKVKPVAKSVKQYHPRSRNKKKLSKGEKDNCLLYSEVVDEIESSEEIDKQSENSDKLYFTCAKCSFTANTSQLLKRHERIHEHAKVPVDTVTCDECEMDFKLKRDLIVHQFEIHNKQVPQSYRYLVDPSKCKILPDRYKCSYNSCEFSCKFLYMLDNHKANNHRKLKPKSKPPRRYKQASTEVKEDRYSCPTCGFVCKFKKSLQKHTQEAHKKSKAPKIGGRGSVPGRHCEYCNKYIIGSTNHYLRHMCIHTGEKPFSCDDCGKCYTEKASLNQHKLTHGEASDYLCEDCGKAFKRAINLRMHKRIHLKTKPHECSLCDYKCRRRDSLGLHMKRKHLKEKRFLCDHCGKPFFSDQERNQHLKRKHLPRPMPFICPLCEEPFKFEYNMRAHMKTHPNYKPNKCSYCDFETRTKAALKDHVKKHTGEKTKSCDLCDYVTSTCSNLYKHRKRTHGINSIRPVVKLNDDCTTVVIDVTDQASSTGDASRPVTSRANKYTSNVISQALAEARIAQADVYDNVVQTCPPQVTRSTPVQMLPQNLVSSIVPLTPGTTFSLGTNLPIIPSTSVPVSMNSMFPDNIVSAGMTANLVVATPPIPTASYYTNLMTYHNLQ